MDSNGLRSFGLVPGQGLYVRDVLLPVGEEGSTSERIASMETMAGHRVAGLRLASVDRPKRLVEAVTRIENVVIGPAMALDGDGNTLRWTGTELVSFSALAATHGLAPRNFAVPAAALPVSDLALGDDGILYLAGAGALWMVDLRGRFETTRIAPPQGLAVHRLAARPGQGVWVLDVARGCIARHTGRPPFTRGLVVGDVDTQRFASCEPGADPSQWWLPLGGAAVVPPDERPAAISANAQGEVALLSLRRGAGGFGGAVLRLLFEESLLAPPLQLRGPKFPVTLGWLDADRLATAADVRILDGQGRTREAGAWAYALPPGLREALRERARSASPDTTVLDTLLAEGDYRPLTAWTGGPFCNGRPGGLLHYPRQAAAGGVLPARLARIATAQRLRYGWASNLAATTQREGSEAPTGDSIEPGAAARLAVGRIDTRDPATVWHRLHLEAVLPPGCAMLVWLATSAGEPPAFQPQQLQQQAGWHPHLFGERNALPEGMLLPEATPRAVWQAAPTEVPLGQGLMGCAPVPQHCGCFSVLVQRAGLAVRSLAGARLWVVVECFGDGRNSPELVALRTSAGRVSYRDRYLPALYHERAFGADADQRAPATGADFLDRLLHLFEGLFTQIEDRVAAAALVTDARACPPAALPWLAAWLGLAFDTPLPEAQMRRVLVQAGALAREHGTLQGLQRMLDLLTDGAVTQGRVVVVEDFRLRRTLATILGADFIDARDPLTAGLSRGGQSVVGETLFVGDAATLEPGHLKSFLALFRRIDVEDADEVAAARRALFDGLAHRVTVLVHETLDDDEFGRIQRLVQRFAPAHVLARTVRAPWPFITGVAALVGADTFLRAPRPERSVRLHPHAEGSALGGPDTLRGPASLDAHAGALDDVLPPTAAARPVARVALAQGDALAQDAHRPLLLDGSGSTAAPGRHLQGWEWRHLPPA